MSTIDQIKAKNPKAFSKETMRFFDTKAVKASLKTKLVYVYNNYHGQIPAKWTAYELRDDLTIGLYQGDIDLPKATRINTLEKAELTNRIKFN